MRVVVVALGKMGLPLATYIARAGHDVVGCDIDARTVDAVNAGISPFPGEPGLAWKRRSPGVDELDDARVDVAADDVVARARDVRRQRQAHLADRDDDRSHPHTRTVCEPAALSSTRSAQRTVWSPSSSDTAGEVSSPRTRSQNASSSTSSGSRRCSA